MRVASAGADIGSLQQGSIHGGKADDWTIRYPAIT